MTSTTTHTIGAELHFAADWLDAHPDLTPFAVTNYGRGVMLTWHVATDAEADALFALTDDDGWRHDHRYEDTDWSRIAGGHLGGSDRLELSVAVAR